MDKKIKISLKGLWTIFMAFSFSIICVGGYNPYFMSLRTPLFIVMSASSVAIAIFVKQKVTIDYILALFFITTAYIVISSLVSPDYKTAIGIAITYICGTALLLLEYPDAFLETVLKFFTVFCIVIALSIIISVFIDDCMNRYFSWLLNPTNSASVAQSIRDALKNSHAYVGFAREKGEAAYIMGMGIAIQFAKYFSGKKFTLTQVAFLALELIALLLTSKRMILVCVVIAFSFMILISKQKGKLVKIFMIALILICAFFVLSAYIPQLSNVFDRFTNDSNDALTGRDTLWQFSILMFNRSPLFGYGFASFNYFSYNQGFTVQGEQWTAFGHNVYLEFLGELGIIGFLLFFGMILFVLIKTILLLREKELSTTHRYLLMFSFAVQIILLVYCASGNVFLYKDQTLIYIFAIAVTRSIGFKYRRKKLKTHSFKRFIRQENNQ